MPSRSFQVYRAEQFGRFGETSEQVFEVTPTHGLRDTPHHRAFCSAGRPDHQDVLLGHGCQHDQFGQLLAPDQAFGSGTHGVADLRGSALQLSNHGCLP